MTVEDELVAALTALREHRAREPELIARERDAVRAWAQEARARGISGRQLGRELRAMLAGRGWSEEEIRSVPVSDGTLRAVLG